MCEVGEAEGLKSGLGGEMVCFSTCIFTTWILRTLVFGSGI
jgi:hypothetical protein